MGHDSSRKGGASGATERFTPCFLPALADSKQEQPSGRAAEDRVQSLLNLEGTIIQGFLWVCLSVVQNAGSIFIVNFLLDRM